MKKFEFRLDRVLDWRRILVRTEQTKLERIRAEMIATAAREAELRREAEQSEAALRTEGAATGEELMAHDSFRRHAAAERGRLGARRLQLQQRFTEQARTVMTKERDVRLLEQLRERKWRAWTAEQEADIQRQAEETFRSRWRRIQ